MLSLFSELIFSLRILDLLAEVVQGFIYMVISIEKLRVEVACC